MSSPLSLRIAAITLRTEHPILASDLEAAATWIEKMENELWSINRVLVELGFKPTEYVSFAKCISEMEKTNNVDT